MSEVPLYSLMKGRIELLVSGCRVGYASAFRGLGSGFRSLGSGFEVSGSEFQFPGFEFRLYGLECTGVPHLQEPPPP